MNDPLFWLYADNYRTYNINVARKLKSIHAAILLSELASKHRYHRDRNELLVDPKFGPGWFYFTQEDLEERTCLTRKNQDSSIEILEKMDLIEKRQIGIPAKRHFRLKTENIYSLFFEGPGQPSLSEMDKQECPNRTNSTVRNGQTAHIYNKQHYEQQNEQHLLAPSPAGGGAPAASAAKEETSSPQKIKKQKAAFSPQVHEVAEKMIAIVQESTPEYRSPKNMNKFLEHVDHLLNLDKRTPQNICEVLRFAIDDYFHGPGLLTGNLAEKFRTKFATFVKKMRSKPPTNVYEVDRRLRRKDGTVYDDSEEFEF